MAPPPSFRFCICVLKVKFSPRFFFRVSTPQRYLFLLIIFFLQRLSLLFFRNSFVANSPSSSSPLSPFPPYRPNYPRKNPLSAVRFSSSPSALTLVQTSSLFLIPSPTRLFLEPFLSPPSPPPPLPYWLPSLFRRVSSGLHHATAISLLSTLVPFFVLSSFFEYPSLSFLPPSFSPNIAL